MQRSLFDLTIPVLLRGLTNLSGILNKSEKNAERRAIDPSILLMARLAPDMLPLSEQLRFVMIHARGIGARLSGVEVPTLDSWASTFPAVYEAIRTTSDFLESLDRSRIDEGAGRPIRLDLQGEPVDFIGIDYLQKFALPNFYFHLTMSYAILRHNGAPIGKSDYLGNIY